MGTSDVGLPGVELKGIPGKDAGRRTNCADVSAFRRLCVVVLSVFMQEKHFCFFCYKSELLRVQPFWFALCQEQKTVAS